MYTLSQVWRSRWQCEFLGVLLSCNLKSLGASTKLRTQEKHVQMVLPDLSLTVKAATLIFKSGCGSAISSAEEGKSGLIVIW